MLNIEVFDDYVEAYEAWYDKYPAGMYFVKVSDGRNNTVKKLILK